MTLSKWAIGDGHDSSANSAKLICNMIHELLDRTSIVEHANTFTGFAAPILKILSGQYEIGGDVYHDASKGHRHRACHSPSSTATLRKDHLAYILPSLPPPCLVSEQTHRLSETNVLL